jgi:uncharacterized protein (TIGR02271 family)
MPAPERETTPTLYLHEETLRVGKREVVSGRVIVRTKVEHRDETVDLLLRAQDVSIERVPVDRVVPEAPPVREEADTLIVPVLEERVVVQTQLILKEEIRIRRRGTTHPERRTVQLRREVAEIERPPIPGPPGKEAREVAMTDSTIPGSGESYISEGAERQIVALYDTYDQACAARDKLAAAGVPLSSMDLLDRNAREGDTSFTYEHTNEGLWNAIKRFFLPEEDAHSYAEGVQRGHAMLVVRPQPGQYDEMIDMLETTNPADFDTREQEWRSSGWTGAYAGATGATGTAGPASPTATGQHIPTPTPPGMEGGSTEGILAGGTTRTGAMPPSETAGTMPMGTTATGREEVIPVVQEELRVGKREVGRGGMRVRSYMVERPAQAQVQLHQERVEVERRPVDRPAEAATGDAFRERTIELAATEEEPVIAKEARVVEEVALRKEAGERTEAVQDTVRGTEVEVENTQNTTTPGATTPPKKPGEL